MFWVPLIGQLSNGQFATVIDGIVDGGCAPSPDCSLGRVCRCGCTRQVTERRLFVSKDHYNAWLSAERYIGRNLGLRAPGRQ
jgi:hypothetical protein